MKRFVVNICLIIVVLVCQNNYSQAKSRVVTDSICKRMDQKLGPKATFGNKRWNYTVQKIDANNYRVERWFLLKRVRTEQVFYVAKKQLIYSTETIVINDDDLWKGTYYFYKGKLDDYCTLGHGKSESDNWNPEREVLNNFRNVLKQIRPSSKKDGK